MMRRMAVVFCGLMAAGEGGAWAQSLYYPGGFGRSFSAVEGGQSEGRGGDYQEGLRALDEGEWQAAAAAFARVAERKGAAADGALYWKAYAESRQGHRQAALNSLAELRRTVPDSKWLRDAAALDAEMQNARVRVTSLNAPVVAVVSPGEGESQSPDTDIKLLAINSLMTSKPAVAVPALKTVLAGSSPVAVKDRALFVLAQSSSPEAHKVVTDLAKGSADTSLRVRAIRYAAMMSGDEGTRDMIAIFRREENTQVRSAILQGLAMRGNSKALAELARGEGNPQRKAEIARYLFAAPSEDATGYAIEVLK